MTTRRKFIKKVAKGSIITLASPVIPFYLQIHNKDKKILALTNIGKHFQHVHLRNKWYIKSAEENVSGNIISKESYDDGNWMEAVVPGTVLQSYLKNGKYKDPFYDTYNKISYANIPDAGIVGSVFSRAHWYKTSFQIQVDVEKDVIWLNLDGINFQGDIYLNDSFVGTHKGAYKRGLFNITPKLKQGQNNLIIKVHQVPFPCNAADGIGSEEFKKFGQNGPTFLTAMGYDFVPQDGIRDRNMGIFRDVYLSTSGPVVIRDPFMITNDVPRAFASLTFKTFLINSGANAIRGILKLVIEGEMPIIAAVSLMPHETKEITLHPKDYPALIIQNPRLWWPLNKGEQQLYKLELSFTAEDGEVSHILQTKFGIRYISTDLWHGQLRFWVNGRKVFINGGNWVQDAMLRTSRKDYAVKIRQMAQAGINMLRCWSGSGPEHDYFFELCDRYGIMVWVESGLIVQMARPVDTNLFLDNWKDVILRVRKYPSVAYYCGCNEGDTGIPEVGEWVAQYDGTREYLDNSQGNGQRGNPYGYHGVDFLYDYTPMDFGAGPLGAMAGFCNESGQITLPTAEVLKQMIAKDKLWPIKDNRSMKEVFRYHGNGYGHLEFLVEGCSAYGDFDTPDMGGRMEVDNYTFKGQLLGAMVFRGLSEVWKRNKWDEAHKRYATGYMLWTANEAEPVTSGRLVSYSGESNSALYYFAHGNKPLHVQYDYYYHDVSLINDFLKPFKNLQLIAEIRSLSWERLWSETKIVSVEEDMVLNGLITVPEKDVMLSADVHFIYVALKDEDNSLLDEMIYWRTPQGPKYGAEGSFVSLNRMPLAQLQTSFIQSKKETVTLVQITLTNSSESLAFFVRLKIYKKQSQQLLEPVYYADNYFSILPLAKKAVSLEYYPNDLAGESAELIIEGWNLETSRLDL